MAVQRTPLPTTLDEAFAYAQKNGRIVPWSNSGHIALYCVNHPHLRWSTKNISYIGARSVFFDLFNKAQEPECACNLSCLRPVVPDNWQSLIVPLRVVCCTYCGNEICEESSFFSHGQCKDCSKITSPNFARLCAIENELTGGKFGARTIEISRQAFAQLKSELGL
jgi:hypothetical protein